MRWIRKTLTRRDDERQDQEQGDNSKPLPVPLICHHCSHPIIPATFSYAPQFYENQIQPRSPIPFMNAYYQMIPPPFFPTTAAAMPKINEKSPKIVENPQNISESPVEEK